jgi:hypothetical protein
MKAQGILAPRGPLHIYEATHLLIIGIVVFGLVVVPTRAATDNDEVFTKKPTEVYFDFRKIKPGMTRAGLARLFQQDTGGVAWSASVPLPFQRHQTFDYRSCGLIMVDVDFAPSDSKEARPTDVIKKISRPYINGDPKD